MESVAKTSVFAMFRFLMPLLLLALPPIAVVAEPPLQQAAPVNTLEEAVSAATAYSENSGGVGVVVVYGVGNKVSADALGTSFSGEIQRRGYQSQYFIMNGDHNGAAIMFRIGEWNSGLMTVGDAAESMDTTLEKAALQERIVFLKRRMETTRDQLIAQYGEDYLLAMEKRWLGDEER